MYLHIGGSKNLRTGSVIGIFDLDTSSFSHVTKDFLKRAEASGSVEVETTELPKSFILTEDGVIHLSQISASTLLGRAKAEV